MLLQPKFERRVYLGTQIKYLIVIAYDFWPWHGVLVCRAMKLVVCICPFCLHLVNFSKSLTSSNRAYKHVDCKKYPLLAYPLLWFANIRNELCFSSLCSRIAGSYIYFDGYLELIIGSSVQLTWLDHKKIVIVNILVPLFLNT